MIDASQFLLTLGLSFFTSLAFTGFMVLASVSDVPDARSAHNIPIATAGGVGIVAGLGAGLLFIGLNYGRVLNLHQVAPIFSLIFAIAVLGLVDDIHNLSPRLKLFLIAFFAALSVWLIGPPELLVFGKLSINLTGVIGFSGAMLWVFTATNAVNFMDGSNGLMGLVMTLASFAMAGVALACGAPQTALLYCVLSAAILGFVPYNIRRKAQIFSGDIGALAIGFTYACLVLVASKESGSVIPILAGPLLLLPFLTDVLLTLFLRARRGEKIWEAHNQHVYQRLIRRGFGHVHVAWFYGLVTMVIGNAILLLRFDQELHLVWLLTAFVVILSCAYAALHKNLPA